MQVTISKEEPFKVLKDTCVIGKTTSGYRLMYGADKEDMTPYTEETPANEDLIVNGVCPYMWLKLSGNTDEEVTIIV